MRSSLKILSATLLCAIQVMSDQSDQKIKALYDGLLNGLGDVDKLSSWMNNFASDMQYCTKSKCSNKNTFEDIIQKQYFGEYWNLVDNQYTIIEVDHHFNGGYYEIEVDFTYETTYGCTIFESRTDTFVYSGDGKKMPRKMPRKQQSQQQQSQQQQSQQQQQQFKITLYGIINQKFDDECPTDSPTDIPTPPPTKEPTKSPTWNKRRPPQQSQQSQQQQWQPQQQWQEPQQQQQQFN